MLNPLKLVVNACRWVMDPSVSPLRHLGPAQRFQAMLALAMMWTFLFCIGVGAWAYYGLLVAFHLAMVVGIFVTGYVFHRAQLSSLERQPARAR